MWILAVIFGALFGAVVLIGYALSAPRSREIKQTTSRLEALTAPQSDDATRENFLSIRKQERLSTIQWLDELLQKLDLSRRLKLLLYQAELPWTVGRLVSLSGFICLGLGLLASYRLDAALPSCAIGLIGGSLPFLYAIHKRNGRFEQMRQHLPDALDLMSSAIRAGHSLSSAMGMASKESPEPIRREFRQCFDEQNYGLELRAALSNLQYRMPIGELRMIVTAVLIQNETGGNLTEILDNVAHLVRENYRLRRQVMVHTAQGRISGVVLSAMPVALAFLLYNLNPAQTSLLWTHPIGRKAVAGAVVMNILGGLLIRRIVRVRI